MMTIVWGKQTNAPGEPTRLLGLLDHCADVGACFESLTRVPVLRRRLDHLAGSRLDDRHLARMAVLAVLHDFGKVNHGFQLQTKPGAPKVGHVGPVLAVLLKPWPPLVQALKLKETAVLWGCGVSLLRTWLMAAVMHHGRPQGPSESTRDFMESNWSPRDGRDPLATVAELIAAAELWFPAAFEAGGGLPTGLPVLHAFTGYVTAADWLASDEAHFPYETPDGQTRIEAARSRSHGALAAVGLDNAVARARLADASLSFAEMFEGKSPRPVQRAMDAVSSQDGIGLVVLEAETGSGKTEAALRHFYHLFRAGRVDGLYFALPTRASATQMVKRVEVVARRMFGDLAPPVVQAVPGYLRVDGVEGVRLSPFEVLWPDDGGGRHRRWAGEHPKRYLAGAIVVGTVDQVLLSGLQVKHAHMRGSLLLRHLVVVDEVHASDVYMTAVLREVLRRHVNQAGGHALLMSATLGAAVRERLLDPGAGQCPPMPLGAAENLPYPLISRAKADRIEVRLGPALPKKEIKVSLTNQAGDAAAIAEQALEAARAGAKVLVVRNLVRDAVAVRRSLEELAGADGNLLFRCGEVLTVHHSRFAPDDRQQLDEALEASIGKESPAGGLVLVTTQTAEQSLDIDADYLVTDLCPADVLLQRLGRLHRHERPRPVGFATPLATVLAPASIASLSDLLAAKSGEPVGNLHGVGSVYRHVLAVAATLKLLQETPVLTIPRDNRRLVERATHPEALKDLANAWGGVWPRHWGNVTGTAGAEAGAAGSVILDWSEPLGRFVDGKIATRLGEADRLALFEAPPLGPFGRLVRQLRIPGWMAKGVTEEALPEVTRHDKSGFSFRFGDRAFSYDRDGLRLETREVGGTGEAEDD